MNKIELRMVEILKELKEKHGAISVRAEFEAEGTKIEELLRLKEISMSAGLGLTLKIGGCESVRDMLEAQIVGVNYLVAPMVESGYALRKYLQAVKKIFSEVELRNIEILLNVETITSCNNLESILSIPEIDILKGVVIERVDLCFSLGLDESCINKENINQIVAKTVKIVKDHNLVTIIGGGVSADTSPFFKTLGKSLDRYETRKVCFSVNNIDADSERGILKALGFELLWLKNKVTYYSGIHLADKGRMEIIEKNYLRAMGVLI